MSITTVAELIERLGECNPDAPVAIAIQPSWPLEHTISDVAQADDGTVYIAEGAQTGYLPTAARRAIGW
jgi:hypothetical protein